MAQVGREARRSWPRLASATLAVSSSPPSTMTSEVTGRPLASAGTAFRTSPMLSASSYAQMSATTGESLTAR